MPVTQPQRMGRYELLLELGRGGMAELWLGRMSGVAGFSKLVAVKRILPHLAQDKLFAEMFLHEGRTAAQLTHPNVCQVHELGDANGDLFLAMEYLEGAAWNDLVPLLPRDGATLRLVAGAIAQAAEGLHYAHDLHDLDGNPTPVVHRDVSPHNLFVTTGGICKVLDFGIAKTVKDGPHTRTGVLKGKLPYMAPEQIQAQAVDARTDVWALGVVVWEALAGRSLFDRESDFLVWKAITEEPVPALVELGYPQAIDAVVQRALARDRTHRFPTARQFGAALRAAAASVGGAYEPADIVEVVRSLRGTEIQERQREVAAAVARSNEASAPAPVSPALPDDFDATSTVDSARAIDSKVSQRGEPLSSAKASRRRAAWWIGGAAVVVAAVIAVILARDTDPPVIARAAPEARDSAARDSAAEPPSVEPPSVEPPAAERTAVEPVAVEPTSAPVAPAPPEPAGGEIEMPADDARPAAKPVTVKARASRPTPASRPELAVPLDPGFVTVDSSPYATIYAGTTKLGETPLRVKLAAGKHQLVARTADGRKKTLHVTVQPNATTRLGTLTW